jgi:hypothetical protein
VRYLTIRKFSSESGYSEAAIRSKIRDGVWRLGQVWRKAPDGRVLIDVLGYDAWVELGPSPPLALRVAQSSSKSAHLKCGSPAPLV